MYRLWNPLRTFRSSASHQVTPIVQQLPLEDFPVKNEPLLEYKAGSNERAQLEKALDLHSSRVAEVPIVIGDQEISSDLVRYQVCPHEHGHKIARYYHATPELLSKAIDNSLSARAEWERVPLSDRISVFQRAADLMASKYRMDLNACTMLGQSKTIIQAEIDSAAELVDFLRFNSFFAKELTKYSPISEQPSVTLNTTRLRGVEGFMAAVTPFNFTAIGGNLATAPAIMGNVVLWKPSDTAILSNFLIFKILRECGLPPGVINFVPADGPAFGNTVTASPELAALNFTGSVPTFQHLWRQIGANIGIYKNFPRLIGECGGKNYHLVHHSAQLDTVAATTIKSAFEYGGQKCSACSRLYVSSAVWPELKKKLLTIHSQLKIGDPRCVENFFGAVIDRVAFSRLKSHIDRAKSSSHLTVLAGGRCDESVGYFIEPTIIESERVDDELMLTELFGPVLAVYVFETGTEQQVMDQIARVPYGLTGAVYSQDREFLSVAAERLKMTAGNFYINDKCTGSVVGQQPFGGGRISGTNDKAGGPHYMLKFCSPQSIKETFEPMTSWKYPYMN